MLFRKKTRSRFGATFKMMSLGVLVILGLAIISGCGQRYIKIDLNRSDKFNQPVWVGVYFLSQETALDAMESKELADPNGRELGSGVLRKTVFPLYPGEKAAPILEENYNPEIRWVVIAAGFPHTRRCARLKVPVTEGAELTMKISVNEECIVLEIVD
jgi:predicted component of type VI protein secretion system